MQNNLLSYYSQRASEYETVYQKPERQEDLNKLKSSIQEYFKDENMLEIACGTGYFTQYLSQSARSVIATDFSKDVIEIAKSKNLPEHVNFCLANIYELESLNRTFTSVFGGFIWSHIPLQKLDDFLISVHSVLKPGAKVFFADNIYVEGSSTPVSHKDAFGNTFQQRKLKDGSLHEVLKNFPDEESMKAVLSKYATEIRFQKLTYFWYLTYNVR